MASTFRFPIPLAERAVLMFGVGAAIVIHVAVATLLRDIAGPAGQSLRELAEGSQSLRGALAGLVACDLVAGYALWAYVRVRGGMRFDIDDDGRAHFVRPGLPLLGFGAVDAHVSLPVADAAEVRTVFFPARTHVLHVEHGRASIDVPVEAAVAGDSQAPAAAGLRPLDADAWRSSPLLPAVARWLPARLGAAVCPSTVATGESERAADAPPPAQ